MIDLLHAFAMFTGASADASAESGSIGGGGFSGAAADASASSISDGGFSASSAEASAKTFSTGSGSGSFASECLHQHRVTHFCG